MDTLVFRSVAYLDSKAIFKNSSSVETDNYSLIHKELVIGESITYTFKVLSIFFNKETPIKLTIDGNEINKTVIGKLHLPFAGSLFIENVNSVTPYRFSLLVCN